MFERVVADAEPPTDAPSRRSYTIGFIPFVHLVLEVGVSKHVVGRFYGNIQLPGSLGLYVWVRLAALGRILFLGSWMCV